MHHRLLQPLLVMVMLIGCNKGLTPTEVVELPNSDLEFAIEPLGGDPTGEWIPQAENPLQANLVDPSQLSGLVDTLILQSSITGKLVLENDKSFEFKAEIGITPTIKVGTLVIPMPTFADTLDEAGEYQQPWSNAIVLPLQPKTFKIDTLGFTVSQDSLTLITLASSFPFPGFDYIQYYLIFRFQRSGPIAVVRYPDEAVPYPSRKRNFGGDHVPDDRI